MRVLVACEFSGTVGAAFMAKGHEVLTCDLLPTERPEVPHHVGDVLELLRDMESSGNLPDLMIAHPPCTHLAVSGARWFAGKEQEQREALAFVSALLNAPVLRIALENPVSIISSHIRKPDQTVQPWYFGHGEVKKTCLWLKGLPQLKATDIVAGRSDRIHKMSPGPDRWKERSRTYPGLAAAMAEQWGNL